MFHKEYILPLCTFAYFIRTFMFSGSLLPWRVILNMFESLSGAEKVTEPEAGALSISFPSIPVSETLSLA